MQKQLQLNRQTSLKKQRVSKLSAYSALKSSRAYTQFKPGHNSRLGTQTSTPIYKQVWFWLLISLLTAVFIGIGIFFLVRHNTQPENILPMAPVLKTKRAVSASLNTTVDIQNTQSGNNTSLNSSSTNQIASVSSVYQNTVQNRGELNDKKTIQDPITSPQITDHANVTVLEKPKSSKSHNSTAFDLRNPQMEYATENNQTNTTVSTLFTPSTNNDISPKSNAASALSPHQPSTNHSHNQTKLVISQKVTNKVDNTSSLRTENHPTLTSFPSSAQGSETSDKPDNSVPFYTITEAITINSVAKRHLRYHKVQHKVSLKNV